MSPGKTHIVKRRTGVSEPYDERKLYASIYAVCLSVRTQPADAELIAASVCRDFALWLENKQEITSADVRRRGAEYLDRYNTDAAYLYQHHHVIG